MRRLVWILLAIIALGAAYPLAPVSAAYASAAHGAHAMPPGHCHDESQQGVAHVCFGCVALPEVRAAVEPAMLVPVSLPLAMAAVSLDGRRPGLDPPPPREG